jgi:two-component system NtrC family sensor kinase
MNDALILLDKYGKIVRINQVALDLLGYKDKELIGKTMQTFFPEDSKGKDLIDKISRAEIIKNIDFCFFSQPGLQIPIIFSSAPLFDSGELLGTVCLAVDITERKYAEEELKIAYQSLQQTQAQLLQSEKLASIGQLAAGVAHEINNPTGFILSNLQILKQYIQTIFLDQEDKSNNLLKDLPDIIDEIIDGAVRIKNIVSNLTRFAYPIREQFKPVKINKIIEQTISLVWDELKYTCRIDKNFADLPEVIGNPDQLNQVFLNLLMNAFQAIEHKQGLIKVTTYCQDNWIYVEIADNGKGIPEENRKKIFDPFFTTKDVGKGTGLGLSIVYGIIKSHKGEVSVASEVGKGSKFVIKLPVTG